MSHFNQRASSWDTPDRQLMASTIAGAMRQRLKLDPSMNLADYGAGTGLITLDLAQDVGAATAIDSSEGMREVLSAKLQARSGPPIEVLAWDLEKDPPLDRQFDVLVSSMTLHHVKDTSKALRSFFELLRPGGQLALADLDPEEGLFHGEAMAAGVQHHGFDRAELKALMSVAGFVDITFDTAFIVNRTQADGTTRPYDIFLGVARR